MVETITPDVCGGRHRKQVAVALFAVGAIGAGFFVIPLLGYAGTARAAIAVSLALAGATAWLAPARRRGLVAAAGVGLAVLVLLPPATPWTTG